MSDFNNRYMIVSKMLAVKKTISKNRPNEINRHFGLLSKSVYLILIEPPCADRHTQWCERVESCPTQLIINYISGNIIIFCRIKSHV